MKFTDVGYSDAVYIVFSCGNESCMPYNYDHYYSSLVETRSLAFGLDVAKGNVKSDSDK